MMYYERIKQLVVNYGLSHADVAKEYMKANGDKGVKREMIAGMLNGTEPITVASYSRLMQAIKRASIEKAKKLNAKTEE